MEKFHALFSENVFNLNEATFKNEKVLDLITMDPKTGEYGVTYDDSEWKVGYYTKNSYDRDTCFVAQYTGLETDKTKIQIPESVRQLITLTNGYVETDPTKEIYMSNKDYDYEEGDMDERSSYSDFYEDVIGPVSYDPKLFKPAAFIYPSIIYGSPSEVCQTYLRFKGDKDHAQSFDGLDNKDFKNLKSINHMFAYNQDIKIAPHVPDHIKEMKCAFQGCTNLLIPPNVPKGANTYGAVDGCSDQVKEIFKWNEKHQGQDFIKDCPSFKLADVFYTDRDGINNQVSILFNSSLETAAQAAEYHRDYLDKITDITVYIENSNKDIQNKIDVIQDFFDNAKAHTLNKHVVDMYLERMNSATYLDKCASTNAAFDRIHIGSTFTDDEIISQNEYKLRCDKILEDYITKQKEAKKSSAFDKMNAIKNKSDSDVSDNKQKGDMGE